MDRSRGRALVLAGTGAALLPAVLTLITGLASCEAPAVIPVISVISDIELPLSWLLVFGVAIWLPTRVLMTSRLNLFADPVRLVAGAVKGRLPHLIVVFLLVQSVLFWITIELLVKADVGGCGA